MVTIIQFPGAINSHTAERLVKQIMEMYEGKEIKKPKKKRKKA